MARLEDLDPGLFKPHEFACRCGCGLGLAQMQAGTIDRLQRARRLAGVPFALTSAMRCPRHNERQGGDPTSSHLLGYAVDVACPSSTHRYRILVGALGAGFSRIGIGKTFIHLDDDPGKPPELCWGPGKYW